MLNGINRMITINSKSVIRVTIIRTANWFMKGQMRDIIQTDKPMLASRANDL
ncbi:hypothetical protein L915_20849 [Phytophthora nicotianae]|uniref:Uncharacterized protein n=1 Tax=Phytophthora nicotianae TaxID=4792 RepID=W2HTU9_PHYNI|nr:hypothetical protein L915_20849 [Phytophthora nicotianae]ETL25414.1 hypothetical protein L916_20731 [Phytophthora nicotianae]